MEEALEERIAEFVELDAEGKVKRVRWKNLAEYKNKSGHDDSRLFDGVMGDVSEFCRRKRFLTSRLKKGSFAVIDGDLWINIGPPCGVMVSYNFMTLEDAEEYKNYAREFFGGRGPVSVVQIA